MFVVGTAVVCDVFVCRIVFVVIFQIVVEVVERVVVVVVALIVVESINFVILVDAFSVDIVLVVVVFAFFEGRVCMISSLMRVLSSIVGICSSFMMRICCGDSFWSSFWV